MAKVGLVILFFILSASIFFVYQDVQKVKNYQKELVSQNEYGIPVNSFPSNINLPLPSFPPNYDQLVAEEVAKAIASLSALPKTTTTPAPQLKPAASQAPKRTSYVPLSGTFSTTSTEWTDASGAEAYIDLENDYGKNAQVTFEATLKIANASGAVYARLFDATHGIAVDGSEVKVESATLTSVSTGSLPLWRGNNLYKVQIKSLTSEEATFGSGRVKINY